MIVLKKRKRKLKAWQIIGIAIGVIAFIVLATLAYISFAKGVILLKVKDRTITQGDMQYAFYAEATVEKHGWAAINLSDRYFVYDLAQELKRGDMYTISCDGKSTEEGEYPIHISLNDELKDKLASEWGRHVKIKLKDGTFTVKNPIGEWDGKKFRKYDGTYMRNGFVVSKNETYYFDSDGKLTSGTHVIDGELCVFDNDGKLTKREPVPKTYAVDPSKPMVALTFDDGPGKRTGELLNKLEYYYAHATFFMQGKNVPNYKAEVKKMKQIGCELGNHSFSHPQLTAISDAAVKKQLSSTSKNVEKAAGSGTTVLRPPYGSVNPRVKKVVGMPVILWSVDTLDWKTRNAQKTIDTVMENVRDGDIVLMHDIHSESVDAALELIPMLQEKGYQLVTVSELAKARGIKMKNGEKYAEFWKK